MIILYGYVLCLAFNYYCSNLGYTVATAFARWILKREQEYTVCDISKLIMFCDEC